MKESLTENRFFQELKNSLIDKNIYDKSSESVPFTNVLVTFRVLDFNILSTLHNIFLNDEQIGQVDPSISSIFKVRLLRGDNRIKLESDVDKISSNTVFLNTYNLHFWLTVYGLEFQFIRDNANQNKQNLYIDDDLVQEDGNVFTTKDEALRENFGKLLTVSRRVYQPKQQFRTLLKDIIQAYKFATFRKSFQTVAKSYTKDNILFDEFSKRLHFPVGINNKLLRGKIFDEKFDKGTQTGGEVFKNEGNLFFFDDGVTLIGDIELKSKFIFDSGAEYEVELDYNILTSFTSSTIIRTIHFTLDNGISSAEMGIRRTVSSTINEYQLFVDGGVTSTVVATTDTLGTLKLVKFDDNGTLKLQGFVNGIDIFSGALTIGTDNPGANVRLRYSFTSTTIAPGEIFFLTNFSENLVVGTISANILSSFDVSWDNRLVNLYNRNFRLLSNTQAIPTSSRKYLFVDADPSTGIISNPGKRDDGTLLVKTSDKNPKVDNVIKEITEPSVTVQTDNRTGDTTGIPFQNFVEASRIPVELVEVTGFLNASLIEGTNIIELGVTDASGSVSIKYNFRFECLILGRVLTNSSEIVDIDFNNRIIGGNPASAGPFPGVFFPVVDGIEDIKDIFIHGLDRNLSDSMQLYCNYSGAGPTAFDIEIWAQQVERDLPSGTGVTIKKIAKGGSSGLPPSTFVTLPLTAENNSGITGSITGRGGGGGSIDFTIERSVNGFVNTNSVNKLGFETALQPQFNDIIVKTGADTTLQLFSGEIDETTDPSLLKDFDAQFTTLGIIPGATVANNITDGSNAIISGFGGLPDTVLITGTLTGGTNNVWTKGDIYTLVTPVTEVKVKNTILGFPRYGVGDFIIHANDGKLRTIRKINFESTIVAMPNDISVLLVDPAIGGTVIGATVDAINISGFTREQIRNLLRQIKPAHEFGLLFFLDSNPISIDPLIRFVTTGIL